MGVNGHPAGYPRNPGEHLDHAVAPHNHPTRPKPKGHLNACSGRWYCETCTTWLSSPACPGFEIPGALMGLQR